MTKSLHPKASFFCQKRIEDELQSSRVSDVSPDTP